jgi:hypothetical protein
MTQLTESAEAHAKPMKFGTQPSEHADACQLTTLLEEFAPNVMLLPRFTIKNFNAVIVLMGTKKSQVKDATESAHPSVMLIRTGLETDVYASLDST